MSLIEGNILTLNSANPGSGPIAPIMDRRVTIRDKSYMNIDDNISTKKDNNSLPIINAQKENSQVYINNSYVNFTGREQAHPTVIQQTNLKGSEIWQNLSVFNARTTTRETTDYSYSGNPENQNQGQNFYRYEDKPRTTTNETTNYSYSGNPENQNQGQNFYRYDDKPRTTTNETTLYSYSGDVNGNVISHNQMNRNLYTGDYVLDEKSGNYYNTGTSGVTKWSSKSDTLVKDYIPGANGSVNYQQDAGDKIGSTLLRPDHDSVATKGPGTLSQATPNGTRFTQIDKAFIGEQRINPNKIFGEDTRQIANYQISALKENGLSIYRNIEKTENNNNSIPTFFIDQNKQNYSDYSRTTEKRNENINKRSTNNNSEYQFGEYSTTTNNTNDINQNANKVFNTFNQNNNKIENPLLFTQNQNKNKKTVNTDIYPGLGYSGTALKANKNGVYLDYQINKFSH